MRAAVLAAAVATTVVASEPLASSSLSGLIPVDAGLLGDVAALKAGFEGGVGAQARQAQDAAPVAAEAVTALLANAQQALHADSEEILARQLQAAELPEVPVPVGAPFAGSVAANAMSYFKVDVPQPFSSVRVSLLPQHGNPDLFVTAGGANVRPGYDGALAVTPSTAYYSSVPIGSDSVEIKATDRDVRLYCPRSGSRQSPPCTLHLGVYGRSPSAFTLVVSADGNPVNLTPGQTVVSTGSPSLYSYYSYTPAATASEVAFSLTGIAGAPGVYVTSNGGRPTGDVPSSYCAGFNPAAAGNTAVGAVARLSIRRGDPCWCEPSANCTYNIGVGSSDYSYWSLVAQEGTAAALGPASLLDGVPQRSKVAAASTAQPLTIQYYDFTFVPAVVSAATSVAATISVTQFTGPAVTLYALMWRQGESIPPGPANYHMLARPVDGVATLTVSKSDPMFVATCGGATSTTPCRIRLAVTGAGSVAPAAGARLLQGAGAVTPTPAPLAWATYAIAARTDTGMLLNDGVPQTGSVAQGGMTYFRYTHVTPGASLVLAATGISGKVDMYIGIASQVNTAPPTKTTAVWKGLSNPVDVVSTAVAVIKPDDPMALACTGPCVYYIGIAPAADSDGTVAFSLMARARTGSAVSLVDGQALVDVALPGDTNYYAAVLSVDPTNVAASALTFALSLTAPITPTSALLPLGAFARADAAVLDSAPGAFQFSSPLADTVATEVSFTIRATDAAVQAACPALAALAAPGGVAAAGKALIQCPVQMLITPPATTATAAGSVYAVTAIQAAGDSGRALQDGQPLLAVVAAGSTSYFVYQASAGASHVTLTLTPLSGNPIMYVSATEPRPSKATAALTAGGVGSVSNSLSLPACAANTASGSCVYYVAVTSSGADAGAASTSAAFRIQGTSSKVATLVLGTPVFAQSGPSAMTYFQVFVPASATGGLEVVVETMSAAGVTSVFVGNTVDAATGTNALPQLPCADATGASCPLLPTGAPAAGGSAYASFSATGFQSRTRLFISAADPAFRPGALYTVAVTSRSSAEITLTASLVGEIATLPVGVAMHDSIVAPGGWLYYRTLVDAPAATAPRTSAALTIQATPFMGFLGLTVSTNKAIRKPDANITAGTPGIFTAGFANDYRVDVPVAALSDCSKDVTTGQCEVFVGVQAVTPVIFYLLASSASTGAGASTKRVVAGEATLDAIIGGQWTYYSTAINVTEWVAGSADKATLPTLSASLVALQGEADIFMSVGGGIPTATAYDAMSSATLGMEFVSLSGVSPNNTDGSAAYVAAAAKAMAKDGMLPIVLAVFGEAPFTFYSLTFSVGDTMMELVDGQPVQGTINKPGGYMYYALTVDAAPGDIAATLVTTSGTARVYASRWDAPLANPGFRPSALPGGAAFTSSPTTGMMSIPAADPNACTSYGGADSGNPACVYIFAVWCDDSSAGAADGSASSCNFLLTVSTSAGSVNRIGDGMPARATLPQGTYRYFFFEAPRGPRNISVEAVVDGQSQVQILISNTYTPGAGAAAGVLPTVGNPASYAVITSPDYPMAVLAQNEPVFNLTEALAAGGQVTTSRVYTIGVYCVSGPASVVITASAAHMPELLLPGVSSPSYILPVGQVAQFAIDVRNPYRDLIVVGDVSYGRMSMSLHPPRGSGLPAAKCTLVASAKKGGSWADCGGSAVWQTYSKNGVAYLRIDSKRPCANTTTSPLSPSLASCDPAKHWTKGAYTVTVVALEETQFTVSSYPAGLPQRLLDGRPALISQAADAPQQYFVYPVVMPADEEPDIRLTLSSPPGSAPMGLFINSCVDAACTSVDERPSATNFMMRGQVNKNGAGDRRDVTIRAKDAVYCRADAAAGLVCLYYFAMVPNTAWCAANGRDASNCIATLDITATLLSSRATIVLDLPTLKDKVTVVPGVSAPGRNINYWMYISDVDEEANNVWMRIDTCDTVAGYEVAYFCEPVPSVAGVAPCRNMRAPTPTDYMYIMSTTPDTDGGDGRGRLAIRNTFSNQLYAGVTVTRVQANYTRAMQLGLGPSTYEMSIFLGDALHLRRTNPDGVGMIDVRALDLQNLMVEWVPPVLYNHAGPFQSGDEKPRYVRNATYTVYLAPQGFAASAGAATTNGTNDAGLPGNIAMVMPTTACGMDRWASIVTKKGVAPGTPGSWANVEASPAGFFGQAFTVVDDGSADTLRMTLGPLYVNYPYEVTIVASCDDACLNANAVAYGFRPSETAQSVQRMPYPVVQARTLAPVIPSHRPVPTTSSTTSALVPIGIIAAISTLAAAVYISMRQAPPPAPSAAGDGVDPKRAEQEAGPYGVFLPRTPTVRRALLNGASQPAADEVSRAAETSALNTLAARLQSKTAAPVANPVAAAPAAVVVTGGEAPAFNDFSFPSA